MGVSRGGGTPGRDNNNASDVSTGDLHTRGGPNNTGVGWLVHGSRTEG